MSSTSPVRFRPEITALGAYSQGRPAPAGGFKLSSNENPWPPLPRVLDALRGAEEINRYPDGSALELRERIAQRHGVTVDRVHVGAGSISLLTQFVLAAAGPGDEVVTAWRSFEAYPGLVTVAGATHVKVPLTPSGDHDIDAMVAQVTDRTRAIIVCSPNNPTGPVVTSEAFERLISRVPSDVLVLLDEAYREFAAGSGAVDGDLVIREHPNVVALRTFSKAWGLAGLRVGFALGEAAVLDAARATAIALSVTDQAQVAALASLDSEEALLERVADLTARRDRLWRELTAMGWTVPVPWGNFVWLPTGADTEAAALAFEANGVVVRPFLGEGVRITVAEPESVDLVIRTAHDLVATLREPSSGHR